MRKEGNKGTMGEKGKKVKEDPDQVMNTLSNKRQIKNLRNRETQT